MATQLERREATHARLLDAASAVLVREGAVGFTTTQVARQSELSQGALFKHFPTKAELLSATVEHIFDGLRVRFEGEITARAAVVDGGIHERVEVALDLLWDVFGDERLIATYDLYAAARTDPALQADLEPVVREHAEAIHRMAGTLFPEVAAVDPEQLRDAVDLAVATMEGLVFNGLAVPDPSMDDRVRARLAAWIGDRLTTVIGDGVAAR